VLVLLRFRSSLSSPPFFFLLLPPPPPSPLFPYTPLFRSFLGPLAGADVAGDAAQAVDMPAVVAQRELEHEVRARPVGKRGDFLRSEEHTSELQSLTNLVCRLLLEKKNKQPDQNANAPAHP